MDVKIFEVVTSGYDPAEAVRILVLFDKVDAAIKAHIDLQGRFFGGKEVGGVAYRTRSGAATQCSTSVYAPPLQQLAQLQPFHAGVRLLFRPARRHAAPAIAPTQVRVAFFPEERFDSNDLAPRDREFDG